MSQLPASPAEHLPLRDEVRSPALRGAVFVLSACVVMAMAIVILGWSSLRGDPLDDTLGLLLLLGLFTVIGLLVGLAALIGALVHYGRRHSGGRTFGVVCLSLGLLAAGAYAVLVTSRYLDPSYQWAASQLERSQRIGQRWESREVYPACGTVVLALAEPAKDAGQQELRCMRRANEQGEPAELVVTREGYGSTRYVRTEPDRTLVIYVHEGTLASSDPVDSGFWRYRACPQGRVDLRDLRNVCAPR